MKKALIILLLAIGLKSSAQDTTIATLSLKARVIQVLAPWVKSQDDTSFVNLFHKWSQSFRASSPSGTTPVSVDSVPVVVIQRLYDEALSWPQGSPSVGDDFKADVLVIRTASTNLDRLLDVVDAAYSDKLTRVRTAGRRLLTGRNQ